MLATVIGVSTISFVVTSLLLSVPTLPEIGLSLYELPHKSGEANSWLESQFACCFKFMLLLPSVAITLADFS